MASPGLFLTRNFSKIDQNHDHKKCYLFSKEATWCDENLGLVAHWWPAKWQVEWRICKIRKCARDAKYAGHATYAKCAVVAKFDKNSATSVTKILGVQHIGGKVTGWMYGRADYFFAQPTRKLGGQQPITHPLFIFCANNTSLFVLQISLSIINFGTGPSISNIQQYLIFPKADLSKKKIQKKMERNFTCLPLTHLPIRSMLIMSSPNGQQKSQ